MVCLYGPVGAGGGEGLAVLTPGVMSLTEHTNQPLDPLDPNLSPCVKRSSCYTQCLYVEGSLLPASEDVIWKRNAPSWLAGLI